MEFYSHPGKPLDLHLREVAMEMQQCLQDIPGPGRDVLHMLAAVTGFTHDFGKYTTFFQRYLLEKVRDGDKHHHAFISGLWGSYLVTTLLKKEETTLEATLAFAPLLCFMAITRHHANLDNLERHLVRPGDLEDPELTEVQPSLRYKLQLVEEQVADLFARREDILPSLLNAQEPFNFFSPDLLETFCSEWRGIYGQLYRLHRRFKQADGFTRRKAYFLLLALYSALIDADKREAGGVGAVPRCWLPPGAVDSFKEKKFAASSSDDINSLREEIYQKVTNTITHVSLDQHLFTLTAPTGAGKTLTSLSAALRLRERLHREKGYSARIIYALPFTNIIDQTFTVFGDVLRASLEDFAAKENSYLLKHHYLADTIYKLEGEKAGEEFSLEESLLLIESWQSEIIVTTFVQLLHSLIGFQNRMLKKSNKLLGSIVIMDEVQNIPVEYWELVREVLKGLAEYFGAYIILMTATKPLLFKYGEAIELVGDEELVRKFFNRLNRVQVQVDLRPKRVVEVAAEFARQYDPSRSYLLIVNTINSSLELYQCIKQFLREQGHEPLMFYLSTNVVPLERKKRVEEINQALSSKQKPVVVSTQVVEAGVDLDFDIVWRDLSPIDSIIQAAGRCNRHSHKRGGLVRVLHLVDEEGHTLANRVYGAIHCHVVRKIFEQYSEFTEKDFFDLVEEFFRIVEEKKSKDEAAKIIAAMEDLYFSDLNNEGRITVSDFKLIEELPSYVDVFVELDERAREIWRFYQETVLKEKDLLKRRRNFLGFKRDFYERILSVPAKLALGLDSVTRPLYLSRDILEKYYEPETGFRRQLDDDPIIL